MPSRFTVIVAATFIATSGAPLWADALEDRFLSAQQAFEDRVREFYVGRVPEMEGKLPKFMESARAREAMICALNHIRDEAGAEVAANYVSAIEDMGAQPISSFEDLSGIPDSVPEDVIFSSMSVCDTMTVTRELMEESGMMDAMRNPETLEKLMAPSDG